MRSTTRSLLLIGLGAGLGWLFADLTVPLLGLFVGAVLGAVMALIHQLDPQQDANQEQIRELNQSLSRLRERVRKMERSQSASARETEFLSAKPQAENPAPPPPVSPRQDLPLATRPPSKSADSATVRPLPPSVTPPPGSSPSPATNPIRDLFAAARDWLFTGNVPVKVGVLVIFFGVVFFLMLAVEKGWFSFPIAARLLAVDLGAAVMLAFGWRLRGRMRVYALSLQGGAVGILFADIFVAYRIYDLISAPMTFSLLVVLAAFSGLLAIRQDAMVLAVLGSTGGFLAPVLTTIGPENHVAQFGYYAVLNLAIFGIAFFKAWRPLNLLGFVFTFAIGWLWAGRYYRPEFQDSTLPFVALFFLMFVGVAILYAFRRATEFADYVDTPIVFGTPLFTFAALAGILRESEYGLAICAAVAATVYLALTVLLRRLDGGGHRRLTQAFLSLGVAFGTLSIPLAFDARWTSALWALEATALIWIGLQQRQRLSRVAGIVLHVAAGIAFLLEGTQRTADAIPILNGDYTGTVLLAITGLFAAYHLRKARDLSWILLAVTGGLWWFGGGSGELIEHTHPTRFVSAGLNLFWSASVLAAVALSRRLSWPGLGSPIFGLLPAFGLTLLQGQFGNGHPFAAAGWIAWPIALWLLYLSLHRLESGFPRSLPFVHAPAMWLVTILASLELRWLMDRADASAFWQWIGIALVPGLLVLFVRYFPFVWPVPAHRWIYTKIACAPLVFQMSVIVLGLNLTAADPSPLPYLPLLNPLDLTGCLALLVISIFLRDLLGQMGSIEPRVAWGSLALAIFTLLTATLVRTVHHWADVPFNADALMGSVVLHASLSLFWGSLALSAMIFGARRASRTVWFAGALLMAVVVLKLFVIDLGNSGSVARVVSFIGVGLLLLVVGYFAGVPPRDRLETTSTPPSSR